MGKETAWIDRSAIAASSSDQNSLTRIIAVGDASEWEQQGNMLPSGGIAFLSFHEVTDTLLNDLNPSMIISPVLARHFDCIELAVLLHNLGYSGAYRAMAKDMPKPELIEREVRQICPRLNFKLLLAN